MSCKKYFYTILISIFFFNISLFAQNESLKDTLVLTQTLITAQSRTLYTESLRIVRTINIKEIVGMPIVNLNELLDYLPGVDVRQRGTNGVQADITIRGGTFDQVLILLNGVNITDPQTGHHNLDIPVNISMIDKIEVLQGTTMNQFGLSAFSGAINIITCKSEENVVKAGVAVGQYGYFAPYLGIKSKKNRWNSVFSLSHNYSSGYINNTDYSIGNIFFHTKYNGGKAGMFEFQIGGQMKEFGSNGFYSLSYPNEFEATKTGFIALNLGRISVVKYIWNLLYTKGHIVTDLNCLEIWKELLPGTRDTTII
jgi:iron complex outermembrane receptor protein